MLSAEDIAQRLRARSASPRIEGVKPPVDVRAILHEKQREFFDCDAPVRSVLGGRQGGKTFGVVAWQFAGALETANSFSPYLALTSKSARNIVWPEVRRVSQLLDIPSSCLHEHTLTVKFPNGSLWQAGGTDDIRTIESWRGVKTKRPAIDEMGAQSNDFIAYFVREIIWPTMIRHHGQLAQVGTPSPIMRPGDYWYDQTGPARISETPLFRWTAWDNPALEDVDIFVDSYLKANGLTRESAQFRREWLAEWCEDTGALVFPLCPQNLIPALPERSPSGGILPPSLWRYVIGVDIGVVDATAISVVASHPMDSREFVLQTEAHGHWLVTQLRDRLRALLRVYPRAPVVMDTGGMGRYHAEELRRQWGMAIIPAEKTEKKSHVRDIRDRLTALRVFLLDGPCNDALRSEWATLGWDEKRELPDGPDHASDATLYALRYLRHYGDRDAPPPVPDEVRFEAEVAEMKANCERQVKATKARTQGARWWDR